MLNRTPHWVVGEQKYTNQFQAWEAVNRTNLEPRFNLYEEAFDQLDWTKDPNESWERLLLARCVQLRQKYKNLKLFYSGGRDSYCILLAFIRNQIPIDELLVVDYARNPVRHQEYLTWILPMAVKYLQHNPQAKITTLPIELDDYQAYYTETWSEKQSSTLGRGFFQPNDYGWMVEHKCRITDSSTGIMVGLEKPEIVFKDNKLYATVSDTPYTLYFNNHNLIEFFFVTPDLPELHLKQSRMVVDHLTSYYPTADQKFINDFQYYRGNMYDEFSISCGRGVAFDANSPSQNGKGKYLGNHPVFTLITNKIKDEAPGIWNRYKENLDFFFKANVHAAYDRPDKFWLGAKNIQGKYYYLCDWPPTHHEHGLV